MTNHDYMIFIYNRQTYDILVESINYQHIWWETHRVHKESNVDRPQWVLQDVFSLNLPRRGTKRIAKLVQLTSLVDVCVSGEYMIAKLWGL